MRIEDRCRKILLELGLMSVDDRLIVTPLAGGVSSDIASIELNGTKVCVKFALEKLKVAEDWFAPIKRNAAEYKWLEFAHTIVPDSIPTLLGRSSNNNAFAMEFIQGEDTYLWKTALLNEQTDRGEARKVGAVLGEIHRASANSNSVLANFQNQEDFFAIRLDPYLAFTASRNPELSKTLHSLIDMLKHNDKVLVHGDISPKNIIFRAGKPIILDAECATIGDPCFDVAFCLNHLILKAIHLTNLTSQLLQNVEQFWSAYSANIDWEPITDLEKRVCRLLPALMLARIDGKSPVEYLTEERAKVVRSLAVPLITNPPLTLVDMVKSISTKLEN